MAEAAPGSILSELEDITECSICTATFKDPRILPCIHTFCLKCMQQMAKRGDKKLGDKLPCPICRKEITIAGGEEMGLQKNFFMSRLIEMMKICKPADKETLCNVCLLADTEDSSTEFVPPATMYCIDCHDNLCSECSKHHRKQKMSRDHKVISLGSEMKEELLEKSVLSFCDEHKKEQLKLYCVGCQMLVCVLCFVESHKLHDCRDVSKVADELRSQIIADISRASNHLTEMFAQKRQLEKETTEFLTTIAKVESEILQRSSELKELVDKSTASLLGELSAVKQQRLKEIENKKEDNEMHLTVLNTFKAYCNGIVTKGSDGDVCRVVNDLQHRADELQQLHLSCISQNLPSMKVLFQITNLDPTAEKNIIGSISVTDDPEKFTFFWRTESPFSQWHPCSFVIDDQWYNCAEQYMMHQKAVKFGDSSAAWEILSTKDPKRQKHMGRKVMNFDEKEWNLVCKDVVKRGNLAKFGQNENLKQVLFETVGTTLVEASPVDNIWGIGLDESDPKAQNRKTWKGENRLGQILTEIREELMSQGNEKVHSQIVERSLGAREKGDTGKPMRKRADDVNPDLIASRKERAHQKDHSQGGKSKRGPTQRQNSPLKMDRITKDENCDVEIMREVENCDDKMTRAESKTELSRDCQNISVIGKTEDIMETNSVSHSQNEAPVSLEKMEFSSVNLQEGNEEAEEAVDPAWDGFNAMDLDIEEDVKEKKRRERSKDISHQNSDKLRQLQKGKTGYSSRQEQEQPEDAIMFDDQGPREKFTFFWRADSPFSQHHPANFNIDGVWYNCAEQYMMHQKAVVFGDDRVGYEIMQTINPAKQKSLAKQVEGFNEVYWKTLRRDVVKRGNIEKVCEKKSAP